MLQNHFCWVCLSMVITFTHESPPVHLSLCLPVWHPCVSVQSSNEEFACVSPVRVCVSFPPTFLACPPSHCSPIYFPQPSRNPQGPFPQIMWRLQYTAWESSSSPAWWASWWCAAWGTLQRNPTSGASQRCTSWASRSLCAAR